MLAFPTVASVETFTASLRRCLAAPSFLLDFYGVFMDSSEDVRRRFQGTDFTMQTRILADSLWVMANVAQAEKRSPAWGDLPRLAERHSRRGLDIPPNLYDQWLECLVQTVRKHDPLFSPEIEAAWRETLAVGIEYMRSKY